MLFEAFCLVSGYLNDSTVFGTCEIGRFHRTVVEMSDRNECLEVGSLDETEIVRVDAEHIIHHYPAVLADAFPDIGSLAAFRLVV